jgi:GTP-binding protein
MLPEFMPSSPAKPRPAATPKPLVNPFHGATFLTTVNDPNLLPESSSPEVAFVGRSNAGKSSAINTLCNRNRLAFVSKTPGRTQHINYFSLGVNGFMVDLPGYGFANAPIAVKRHWDGLIGTYLQNREQLRGLILIMDSRHPLKDSDHELLAWFTPANKPVHVLLTKCDKLSRQIRIETLRKVREELAKLPIQTSAQLFSSLSREGLEEAIAAIWEMLKQQPK